MVWGETALDLNELEAETDRWYYQYKRRVSRDTHEKTISIKLQIIWSLHRQQWKLHQKQKRKVLVIATISQLCKLQLFRSVTANDKNTNSIYTKFMHHCGKLAVYILEYDDETKTVDIRVLLRKFDNDDDEPKGMVLLKVLSIALEEELSSFPCVRKKEKLLIKIQI